MEVPGYMQWDFMGLCDDVTGHIFCVLKANLGTF